MLVALDARVSYTASWFDGIDRNIAGANYGAIASFTRPTRADNGTGADNGRG